MHTVGLLVVLLAQVTTSSTPSNSVSVEPTAHVQAWLLATYPPLRHGDLAIRVAGDGERLRVDVIEESARQSLGSRASSVAGLVVDLHVATDGRVDELTARGALVQSPALDVLKKEVTDHPAWTQDDIANAIMARGGQFGPTAGARLLSSIPSEAVPCPDASVTESAFMTRHPRGPVWTVDFACTKGAYRLMFEPIGGQMIGIAAK